MLITNFNKEQLDECLADFKYEFKFDNNINTDELVKIVDYILNREEEILEQNKLIFIDINKLDKDKDLEKIEELRSKVRNTEYKLRLKGLSTTNIAAILKLGMEHENLVNKDIFINILVFIGTIQFDSSFFNDENIFISDTEEFLDIKKEIIPNLNTLLSNISTYFISLFKSINKSVYTITDNYIDLPNFYHLLFLSQNIYTIANCMTNKTKDQLGEFKCIKNAYIYVDTLVSKYQLCNNMMTDFFTNLKGDNNGQ